MWCSASNASIEPAVSAWQKSCGRPSLPQTRIWGHPCGHGVNGTDLLLLAVEWGFPVFRKASLGSHAGRVRRNGAIFGLKKRQIVREMLDFKILVLDLHFRADVNLNG